MKARILVFLLASLSTFSVQGQVIYTESTEDFPNPERGFYRYTETVASNYSVLTASELANFRKSDQPDGANYSVVSTLAFRYYVLDLFKSTPLSASFLSNFTKDCQAAREAGVKLIPRFTYTTSTKSTGCADNTACPPYGDASKATVLGHIAQLKPLLTGNADVIATLQMGFIGIWGEQYYTDYFGDASSNGQGKLLDQNWLDRAEIVQALLDALPADRTILTRYPQMKQRFVYGVNAAVTSAPLTATEAFNGSNKARVGFHNDCYLSSSNDIGTYVDYGNSSSGTRNATTALRTYFSEDSRFVPVGGETCSDSYSPQNDCEPTGAAVHEFKTMHYSLLNADYNNSVNNDWQTGGCMDQIKKNLGYRLVLKQGVFPTEAQFNGSLSFTLELENKGYASPFNERPIYLVLRHKSNGMAHKLPLVTDIRRWFSGNVQLQETVALPSSVPAGEYDVLLHLPDKYASISAKPEFAIRLANTNVWEASTGFNNLNHVLRVTSSVTTLHFAYETHEKLKISPNPTTTHLLVTVPAGKTANGYTLSTLQGAVLFHAVKEMESAFTIDLSQFPKGAYILRVTTKEGEYVEKVLIQ